MFEKVHQFSLTQCLNDMFPKPVFIMKPSLNETACLRLDANIHKQTETLIKANTVDSKSWLVITLDPCRRSVVLKLQTEG